MISLPEMESTNNSQKIQFERSESTESCPKTDQSSNMSKTAETMSCSSRTISSPDCKIFSRSASPGSVLSLSCETIEIPPLLGREPFPPSDILAFPQFSNNTIRLSPNKCDSAEWFASTICVEEIECFIPDDGSELSTLLLNRIPEMKKMMYFVEEIRLITKNLCSSLRIRSGSSYINGYSFTGKESELAQAYLYWNKLYYIYSGYVLNHTNVLLKTFDSVFNWCVLDSAEKKTDQLRGLVEDLSVQFKSLKDLKEVLDAVMNIFQEFSYKKKITCLVVLSAQILIKIQDLWLEITNLGYYLSKT